MPTFLPVDEQLAYIKKGSAEIVKESELRSKLEKSLASGKPLRVKAGFDPTAPAPVFDEHPRCAHILAAMAYWHEREMLA